MDQNSGQPGHEPERFSAETGVLTQAEKDARLWGMLCHLSALSVFFTGVGFIAGPLIVWLVKKNDIPFVDDQGKESINFQLSMLLYQLVAGVLWCFVIGIPISIALAIANVVLVIIASIKVSNGEAYRYPLTIRFLK